MFKPQFRDDVYIEYSFGGAPTKVQVNPLYCLTDDSTSELVKLLAAFNPQVDTAIPLISGGPFHATDVVNIIKFSDGAGHETEWKYAGLIANYWNHGFPEAYALASAINDIIASMG